MYLTPEEEKRSCGFAYVKFEAYPEGSPEAQGSLTGRYWTSEQLTSGCGTETKMSLPLAETYARDPKFYGGTFCSNCRKHFPVEEFVWVPDGSVLGS